MMESLSGKIACITGASSGIGAATAIIFAKHGSRLVLHGRNKEKLEHIASECLSVGGLTEEQVITVYGDMGKEECVDELADQVIKHFGTVHAVVNNAGYGINGPATTVSRSDMERMMSVHVYGPLRLSQLLMDELIANKGAIVNVASLAATCPVPQSLPYNTAKAAMVGMTKSLALEIVKTGVRVNSVSPAWIATNCISASCNLPKEVNDMFYKSVGPYTAAGHCGKPEDVGHVIAFMASDGAAYMSGQDIPVDMTDRLASMAFCNEFFVNWIKGETLPTMKGESVTTTKV